LAGGAGERENSRRAADLARTSDVACGERRTAGMLALTGTLFMLSGCSSTVQYVIRQGFGQFTVLWQSVPIDRVLASGKLDAEQQRKLELVVAARDFASRRLGLKVGRSFQRYHDTSGNPVAYNLSAARQDALVSKSWSFPIIGQIEYLGFFARDDAEEAAADLQKEGYDTYIYGVDAYSTLGWFPDPVHSAFLKRSDGSLVETVIHELAHNTVYANGQSTFNESLATYIGRLGARLFYEERGDAGRQTIDALEKSYADEERITAWMVQFEADLRAYYVSDIPSEEKVAGREALFEAARDRFVNEVKPTLNQPDRYAGWANLPTNNAFVLLHRRYHLDLDVFATIYEQNGHDFAALLDTLRAAAKTADPSAYLREVAGSP
jgi:predicted aminopeptidase